MANITINPITQRQLQRSLRGLIKQFKPAQTKRVFVDLGQDAEQDFATRFIKQESFDGGKWPKLKPATMRQKRRLRKETPLVRSGAFQKFKTVTPVKADEVTIASDTVGRRGFNYGLFLNELRNNPFEVVGIGRGFLKRARLTLTKWMRKWGK